MKPLKSMILTGIILFCIFVISGGVYSFVNNPPSVIPLENGGYMMIHPYFFEQTLSETILSMICYIATFAGLLICYKFMLRGHSTQTLKRFYLGLLLFFAGISGSTLLLFLKGVL